jgi:transposase
MEPQRRLYPSDLSDSQWHFIKDVVPAPKPGGRPAKYSRREVVNALLYLRRTGCQWHALPHDLPPWKLVYWYYKGWRDSGLLERINDRVRSVVPRGGLVGPPTSPVIDRHFGLRRIRRPASPTTFPLVLEGN